MQKVRFSEQRVTRPIFSSLLITLYGCLLLSFSSCSSDNANKAPNILLIITDDQGYGDLSCHGNPWLKTPHLDKLHSQSTRLTDFHVSPTCSPTRAALLTGHDANRTGVWHTVGGRSLIKESEITLAEVLKQNGYKTGIFGKWHLGDNHPFRPQDKGFDEVLIHGGGGVGQQPDHWDNNYFNDNYFHNGEAKEYKGYCTDVWFKEAAKFIKNNKKSRLPFFCYLSTNAPHGPYYVADEYSSKYKGVDGVVNHHYYGMVDNIDKNVGTMMNLLDSLNIADNTIVIFMTDNGVGNGAGLVLEKWDGNVAKGFNAGMRGAKVSMYEGGHRVPFFIRWPNGGIAENKDINELTAHVDLFPTLIDALGLQENNKIKFDGTSLWQLLTGQVDKLPKRTLITDSQRLEYPEKWRRSSTMQDKWRLINGEELYHIGNDPGQVNDIAEKHPEIVEELRGDYNKWWEGIKPEFAEYPAIHLVPEGEKEVVINTMDLHVDEGYREVPWHQRHIRTPLKVMGWYAVNVLEDASYRFTLYRWPIETNTNNTHSIPVNPAVPNTNVPNSAPGEAIALKFARVMLDSVVTQIEMDNKGIGASVEIKIRKGFHKLRTDFIEQDGTEFSAFYVKIEKI